MTLPEIIPHGTDEWFAARVGKWTASAAPTLMDRLRDGSPSKKARDLIKQVAWERLAGQPYEVFRTRAMTRGSDMEDGALCAYEAQTLSTLSPGGLVMHPELPNVAATPDAFVGEDGLAETKVPASGVKFLDYHTGDELKIEYQWQVIFQLWVTGRQWCDLVAYDPRMTPRHQLVIKRVKASPEMIEELAAAVTDAEARAQKIVRDITGEAA